MRQTSETKARERFAAFIFGGVFAAIVLGVALFIPEPSRFQYTVFRIVLALAAAGVAAFIPGFINVSVKGVVRAGGAMAVFVIVFFFSPASLITNPDGSGSPTNIQNIGNVQQTTQAGNNTAGVQGNVENKSRSEQPDRHDSAKNK